MIRCCIVADDIVNNVIEYDSVPQGTPPGFPDGFIAVASDTAQIGWIRDGETFINPNPPSPPAAVTLIDGVTFLQRFTPEEYQAITTAGRSNAQLGMWIEMLRMRGEIDVTGDTAQAAKAGVVAANLLTQARADAVFTS